MAICRFDTFEDEKEITELIKLLQEQCSEYMKGPDAWEFECPEHQKLTEK